MPEGTKAKKRFAKKVLTPLEGLERLQKNGISREAAAKWCAEIRAERRAWGIATSRKLKKAWAAVGKIYHDY
jgi:hypothetical protein